ncbi:MAG TPA: ABC transporter substrate-binding protein [Solirubrobacter sp.]
MKSCIGGAGIAGALALLALAGCGGGSKSPKASATPGKALGAIYQPGDVSFGVLAPTSGQEEQRGRDLVDGAQAAIDEINVRGGVNGHKAVLVTHDDGCDAKTARASAAALKDADVAGVVGGVCAGAARAATSALGSDLPFVVTSASTPGIVSARRTPTAFLANGTPYQSALAASHWLVYQRAQKISVVTEDDRASKYLGAQVLKLAAPVPRRLSQQAVPADTRDWGAAVRTALAGGPDIVYWAGSAAGGGGLLAALRDAGYDGKFVADAQAESPAFLSAAGAAADGAFVIAPASPQYLPAAAAWSKRFEQRFKHAPGFDALQAYESVRALAQAITQSGKVDPTRNTRELVIPAGDYKTLLGDPGLAFATDHTIKFDNNISLKVEGGKFVIDNTLRSGAEG